MCMQANHRYHMMRNSFPSSFQVPVHLGNFVVFAGQSTFVVVLENPLSLFGRFRIMDKAGAHAKVAAPIPVECKENGGRHPQDHELAHQLGHETTERTHK